MAVGDIHGLRITDIPAPAKKRPIERMALPGVDAGHAAPKKRKRVADRESDLRDQLKAQWDMKIPAGSAGNAVYDRRMKVIKVLNDELTKLGVEP